MPGTARGAQALSIDRDLARAVTDLEDARRRLRIALLQLGTEQGRSIGEVTGAMGISRQVAFWHLAQGK